MISSSHGEEYRLAFAEAGGAAALAHVIKVNPHDQGALDLACITAANMVGTHLPVWFSTLPFSPDMQLKLTQEGVVQEILDITTGHRVMWQLEHGGFNFNTDVAYNVNRDCFAAL